MSFDGNHTILIVSKPQAFIKQHEKYSYIMLNILGNINIYININIMLNILGNNFVTQRSIYLLDCWD